MAVSNNDWNDLQKLMKDVREILSDASREDLILAITRIAEGSEANYSSFDYETKKILRSKSVNKSSNSYKRKR